MRYVRDTFFKEERYKAATSEERAIINLTTRHDECSIQLQGLIDLSGDNRTRI